MKIIPAIDIQDGKCVRLTKGDLNSTVKYFDDPTNSDDIFTRYFLRMNVIPELKKIKDNIHIPFNNFTQ